MNLDDYFTAPEAAAKAGIQIQAFYKRLHRGVVPHIRVGRTFLIHKRDMGKIQRPNLGYKGGIRSHPLYSTYMNMLRRCYNPKCVSYHRYGGRGIKVCKRWRENFHQFCGDMGPKPGPGYSIERKNNNGNYQPSNCKWATQKEQMKNREACKC